MRILSVVHLIGHLSVGSDVAVIMMVCMSILAVLSTPLGMIECVKSASQVVFENEHNFLFDCPAYAHIRYCHVTLFHGIQTVSSVINSNNACLVGRYLRQCFEHRQHVVT